jgi:hypothetical protein
LFNGFWASFGLVAESVTDAEEPGSLDTAKPAWFISRMIRPNLFGCATSELSEDAFLCWLIANAGFDQDVELRDVRASPHERFHCAVRASEA